MEEEQKLSLHAVTELVNRLKSESVMNDCNELVKVLGELRKIICS